MKKTNPSFNSFSPFSLSNPYFAQTITIAIVIAVHRNDLWHAARATIQPGAKVLLLELLLTYYLELETS